MEVEEEGGHGGYGAKTKKNGKRTGAGRKWGDGKRAGKNWEDQWEDEERGRGRRGRRRSLRVGPSVSPLRRVRLDPTAET